MPIFICRKNYENISYFFMKTYIIVTHQNFFTEEIQNFFTEEILMINHIINGENRDFFRWIASFSRAVKVSLVIRTKSAEMQILIMGQVKRKAYAIDKGRDNKNTHMIWSGQLLLTSAVSHENEMQISVSGKQRLWSDEHLCNSDQLKFCVSW